MQCPNSIKLYPQTNTSELRTIAHSVIKAGFFYRQCDKALIQRYRCLTCKRSFSTESYNSCIYQKKRHLNFSIFEQLNSGNSLRRISKLLRVDRKTVVRKFIFLGANCLYRMQNNEYLSLKKSISNIVFDDMESFEHTKCKPLSISLAVEEKTRFILGFRVSIMPAKGLIAAKSRLKYGARKDERRLKRRELFKQLKNHIVPNALFKTDQNPHYPADLRSVFPESKHIAYKGKRGCIVGQGELKAVGFDPLFSFNHTAAMLRANINRLFRRTWCTSKKAECLEYHIALYSFYHNFFLLNPNQKNI